MYNEFVCKNFNLNKINGFQVIANEDGVHALKVPDTASGFGIPYDIRALDFDLIYFNKTKGIIDLKYLNTNMIYVDFFNLTKDVWNYCQEKNIEIGIVYYTSYKKELSVTPDYYIKKIIGNDNKLNKITVFINTPTTQDDLVQDLHGTADGIIIYSTLKGILQLDPLQMAKVIQNDKKELDIENTIDPDPIFQNCIDNLQNEFYTTLVAKSGILSNWEFERMAIEGNVIFYNRTSKIDVFPNRANNYDLCDLSLPTIVITNSKYDLQFCYNLYLYEEYLKIYFEILGGN